MFDDRPEEQRRPMRQLYALMVDVYNGDRTKQDVQVEKNRLRTTLRGMGVLPCHSL